MNGVLGVGWCAFAFSDEGKANKEKKTWHTGTKGTRGQGTGVMYTSAPPRLAWIPVNGPGQRLAPHRGDSDEVPCTL